MFERLNRLRSEHERARKRLEEAQAKLDEAAAKLKAEEESSILGIVETLDLTPEQLAEFLGVSYKQKKSSSGNKKKETEPADTKEQAENDETEDVLNEIY